MGQLLQIDNVKAIDTFEELGQFVIAAIVVDQLLDLVRVELHVANNRQVAMARMMS